MRQMTANYSIDAILTIRNPRMKCEMILNTTERRLRTRENRRFESLSLYCTAAEAASALHYLARHRNVVSLAADFINFNKQSFLQNRNLDYKLCQVDQSCAGL